jgi:hypothetical protein
MPADKSYQTFLRTRHLSPLCNNHSSCALGGPSGDLPETRLSAFRHILKPVVAFINGFVFAFAALSSACIASFCSPLHLHQV